MHLRKRATLDVISAMNFLANTLTISQRPLAKRLFCGLFHIGERWGLYGGFKMKKTAMFALNAAIKFTG